MTECTFAKWLQCQMEVWRCSEHELAGYCGISERTVRAWLYGERHPSFKQLIRITHYIGNDDHNPILDWSEDLT